MAYIDYEFYTALYGPEIPETDFNRLVWDACRRMDARTTGIDRVKKLRSAFPVDEEDAEAVQRCAAALVNALYQIEAAEKAAQSVQGYIAREDGTVTSKVVTSLSAGNESIGFSAGGSSSGTQTSISAAVSNSAARNQLLDDTVTECLSGVADANGVNLLYMGRYPCRINGGRHCV